MSTDQSQSTYATANASVSSLLGPPRVAPEECIMSPAWMYPGASYRNSTGRTKRTFIMNPKDAELWDKVATFKSQYLRPRGSSTQLLAQSAVGAVNKTGKEKKTRPGSNLAPASKLAPSSTPPSAVSREMTLDLAFDRFANEEYSDGVLQAFYSMDDSDTDDSDIDEWEGSENLSVLGTPSTVDVMQPLPRIETPNQIGQPILDDFMVSWGSQDISARRSSSINTSVIGRLESIGILSEKRRSVAKKPRTHAKLSWDMLISYSMGKIPRDVDEKRRKHGYQTTPHSMLLYKDQVTTTEYQQLSAVRKGFEERCKLIQQLLQQRIIIMIQRGKSAHERVMRILCPFEALIKEAEAIELRKTLRPGLVRLKIGRFASDEANQSAVETFEAPLKCNSIPVVGSNSTAAKRVPPIITSDIVASPISPTPPIGTGSIALPSNSASKSELDRKEAVSNKPGIVSTHPYLAYKTETAIQMFWNLFKPPPVDVDKHSDHFRVKNLKDFEGGTEELWMPHVKLNFFKPSQRNNLVASILTRNQVSVSRLAESGHVNDFFPPNDSHHAVASLPSPSRYKYHTCVRYHLYQSLKSSFRNPLVFISWDPSEQFRFYYGEKHALYFAWFHYYTKFLWFPTVFGFLTLFYGIYEASKNGATGGRILLFLVDNSMTPIFTLATTIWAVLYLELWQRQAAILSHTWNVADFERGEQIRPQWRHTDYQTENPITKKKEFSDPRFYRMARNFCHPAVWQHGSAEVFATITSSLMSLFFILLLSTWFERLAKRLTDFDNYRTESGYQDALVLKNFLLAVVNSFASLFYIGIVKSIMSVVDGNNLIIGIYKDNCQSFLGTESCMVELMLQMVITFVGIIFSNQVKELLVPALMTALSRSRMRYSNRRTNVDEHKPIYTDEALGFDFISVVIQFGFISLFSCAFPLAPLFALVSNLVELRIDAYKLLVQYRRPFSSRTQDIGLVQPLMQYISSVGVVTNAVVIAFASSSFQTNIVSRFSPDSQLAIRIIFVIVFEHFVGGIKIIVRHFLPSVPRSVRVAVGRRVYRTALETIGSPEHIENADDLDRV
ncbi:calcium-activated chloride channel-domain-containing protein [Obelidium mucronatum]|nr:calcium-activated chloride channel-domain-containing protein [Obelidium mucronatum]